MVLLVLGTRFRNFQVQSCRTTTSISEVVSSWYWILTDSRSQVQGSWTQRDCADSPEPRHVSPDSSHRKRPAGELLSKQEAKSRRSKHPRSRSRGQRFREASSKFRSLSSDDHIQPVLHAPSRKLPPRPSSPPPGFVGLYSHHPHTSALSSNQPHDGAPNVGARWLTPPGPHAYTATPTTTTLLSTVATPAEGCNTYASPVPVHVPKQRTDPYVYTQATKKAAPPLPGQLATRFAPGHWGTPAQMLESLQQTTDTAVETLRRKLQDRSSAGRQQQVTPAHNAPLPPPPPPPPPAIPIPTATATQSTPLTTQLTAHTNANQQHSSAVVASSHAPQQFLPQRLRVS